MKSTGPGKPQSGYLCGKADPDALIALDAHYDDNIDGYPRRFRDIDQRRRDVYWGNRRSDGRFELGVRGRIWAMSLLAIQRTGDSLEGDVATTLAEHIYRLPANAVSVDEMRKEADFVRQQRLAKAKGKSTSASAKSGDDKLVDTPPRMLRDVIAPWQRERCPSVRVAKVLTRMVANYMIHSLLETVADAKRPDYERALLAATEMIAAKPSTVYRALLKAAPPIPEAAGIEMRHRELGAEDAAWLAELGDIDDAIALDVRMPVGGPRRFVEVLPGDHRDTVVAGIRQALQQPKPRITVVSGPTFTGKKLAVKKLLREIAAPDDRLVHFVPRARDDAPPVPLPVRVFAANRVHYRALVDNVRRFLEEYDALSQAHGIAPQPERPDDIRPIGQFDGALEHMYTHYGHLPVLFVFTDVDAFQAHEPRHAVRDLGIAQLIEALLATNANTRIIITTTEPAEKRMLTGVKVAPILMTHPTIDKLGQFMRILPVRVPSALRLPHHATAASSAIEIRIDDLIGLGALFSLAFAGTTSTRPLDADDERHIKAFLSRGVNDRDGERRGLYRSLIAQLRHHKILYPMALIAASDDGVRDNSLKAMLSRWAEKDEAVGSVAEPDIFTSRLQNIVDLTGYDRSDGHRVSRLLRRRILQRYDPEEYRLSEEDMPGLVWEMEPSVALSLMEALREVEPLIYAQAHRLIARIARRLAQNKKVFMRAPRGSRATEDSARDIQTYSNLLASITIDESSDITRDGPPLRLSEGEVFAIDPQRFRPARALRYAVYCLLREDIDHDFRLTMVFDEDALRLNLYLLLFRPLGRIHRTETEALDLPHELPLHLTNGIFNDAEVIDLMGSVALSAFHAQRYDIVEEIAVHAAKLFPHESGAIPLTPLVRIWCSQIDAYILQGCRGADPDGLHAALAFVRALRSLWFGHLPPLDTVLPLTDEDRKQRRPELRLLAREAELLSLIHADRSIAAACYAEVERIEACFSGETARHDPVVLSGRMARRYIRFLLKDPRFDDDSAEAAKPRRRMLNRARELLGVNISRLRRFSGADRVGVLLDLARINLAEKDYAAACKYAVEANERAFSGSVSHASKLDVFEMLAETHLRQVALAIADKQPLGSQMAVATAGRAAHNLKNVAEKLGYRPALATAAYLRARCLKEQYRLAARDWPHDEVEADPRHEALTAIATARRYMDMIGSDVLEGRLSALKAEIMKLYDEEDETDQPSLGIG